MYQLKESSAMQISVWWQIKDQFAALFMALGFFGEKILLNGEMKQIGQLDPLMSKKIHFILRKSPLGDTATNFIRRMEISSFIPTEIETKQISQVSDYLGNIFLKKEKEKNKRKKKRKKNELKGVTVGAYKL